MENNQSNNLYTLSAEEFIQKQCARSKSYVDNAACGLDKLYRWTKTDVEFYGGSRFFDKPDLDYVIDQCVEYALKGVMLPA